MAYIVMACIGMAGACVLGKADLRFVSQYVSSCMWAWRNARYRSWSSSLKSFHTFIFPVTISMTTYMGHTYIGNCYTGNNCIGRNYIGASI